MGETHHFSIAINANDGFHPSYETHWVFLYPQQNYAETPLFYQILPLLADVAGKRQFFILPILTSPL
jgi:hypothetical protein